MPFLVDQVSPPSHPSLPHAGDARYPLARRFTSSSRTRVSAPIKFRCIEEGRGGTLHFRNPLTRPVQFEDEAQERIRHVGTLGVKTCVGVYFAIDDDRCFVAHINAYTQRADPWYSTVGDRTVRNDAEADFFRTATREKLKEHAAAHDWDPKTSESRILHSLLLFCRSQRGSRRTSGFVVWHPGGEPALAPYEQRGTAWRVVGEQGNLEAAVPELKGYQKSSEYRVDDWTIVRQAWECR
ncbi:hypothetical protein B0A55_04237 [Friedmanniomyces simplex]|uniref:Uncharacterized protein n=1 Tax=Friedmanniomyces simplex TaxID=329884 RepID=A0A4U0XRT4_9PEZI|nr:hypothetical protein B0A55_04237 [Friedmanniomyces simplex]